mmetsp:Transcript_51558/g.120230  ORF Transcript_51558/g.120230 Transcript_51558/m.120230 type:complete len:245 (+) Transcript_51558:565-1299(+)
MVPLTSKSGAIWKSRMHMKRVATYALERMVMGCVLTFTTPTMASPSLFMVLLAFKACTWEIMRRSVRRLVKNSSKDRSMSWMRSRCRSSASSRFGPKRPRKSSLNSKTPFATSSIVPRCWLKMPLVKAWYSSDDSPLKPYLSSKSRTCLKFWTYAEVTRRILGALQKPNGTFESLIAHLARPTLSVSCSWKARSLCEAFPSSTRSSMDLFGSGLDAQSAKADSTQRRPVLGVSTEKARDGILSG